jgi:hypothetical protein
MDFRMRIFLQSCGVVVAIGVASFVGCGQSDPFEHSQVSGKVTYDDGSLIPAERIVVTFLPQVEAIDAKTHARPGQADVNVADGTFSEATTYERGDGVVAGKHKVLVQALDALGTPTAQVPPEYGDAAQTPLEYDTSSGSLEIKIRKP